MIGENQAQRVKIIRLIKIDRQEDASAREIFAVRRGCKEEKHARGFHSLEKIRATKTSGSDGSHSRMIPHFSEICKWDM